jgi:hypothetical protein
LKKNNQMRSIKEIILSRTGIIKSFNDNKFNLILTPRRWGLTTLLIDYINKIPNDKSILFGVSNPMIYFEHYNKIIKTSLNNG